jgi:hypothetical protein
VQCLQRDIAQRRAVALALLAKLERNAVIH